MFKSRTTLLVALCIAQIICAENDSNDQSSSREERSAISCVQVAEPYKSPYTVCGVAVPVPAAAPGGSPYGSVTHIETLSPSYSHPIQVIPQSSYGAPAVYNQAPAVYSQPPAAYSQPHVSVVPAPYLPTPGYGHEVTHISHAPVAAVSPYYQHVPPNTAIPVPAVVPISNYGHGGDTYSSSSGSYSSGSASSGYGSYGPQGGHYNGATSAHYATPAAHYATPAAHYSAPAIKHYRSFDQSTDLMTSDMLPVMSEDNAAKNDNQEIKPEGRTVEYPKVPVIPNVLPTLPIPTVGPNAYPAHLPPPQYGHSSHPLPINSYEHYNHQHSYGQHNAFDDVSSLYQHSYPQHNAFDEPHSHNIYDAINSQAFDAESSHASQGAPVVGVFNNAASSPCAIPFQVSCSPSIVRGSLASSPCQAASAASSYAPASYHQPTYQPQQVPYAYRTSDDQPQEFKNHMIETKLQPTDETKLLKTETTPKKAEENLPKPDSSKTLEKPKL